MGEAVEAPTAPPIFTLPLELAQKSILTLDTIILLSWASRATRKWATDAGSDGLWRRLARSRWRAIPSFGLGKWRQFYLNHARRETEARPTILYLAIYRCMPSASLTLDFEINFARGDYPGLAAMNVHPNVQSMIMPMDSGMDPLAFRWSLNWASAQDSQLASYELSVWPIECFVQQGKDDANHTLVCFVPLQNASDKVYMCLKDVERVYHTTSAPVGEEVFYHSLEKAISTHEQRLRANQECSLGR